MTVAAFLEEFADTPTALRPGSEATQQRDYETGYKAGWDDASAAQSEAQEQLRTELVQTLQDLSFTFHEARASMVLAMTPVFDQLVQEIVPAALRDTLGLHLVQHLTQAAADSVPDRLTLTLAPQDRDRIEAAFPPDMAAPLELVEDEALAPGQARFQFGTRAARLDLPAVEALIRDSVQGFLTLYSQPPEVKHG